MSYLAIFKRVIPFFLTFAAGLLIASIFIPITAPNFSRGERSRNKCREYNRQLNFEVEALRQERDILRNEVEQLRQNAENNEFKDLKYLPPPPPLKRQQSSR